VGFVWREGLDGVDITAVTGSDLDDHSAVAIANDEVDLTAANEDVAPDDLDAAANEERCREGFSKGCQVAAVG